MRNGFFKVAIASSGLGHVARGMEAWAESLAAALHERGVDVTLFRGAGPAKNDYDVVLPCVRRTSRLARIGNVLNHVGGWRLGLGSEASVESFSYGIRLLAHLRDGYDIVHVQQGSLALFLDRARKLGLLKCSIVFGNGQKAPPEFVNRFPYVHFLSPYGMQEITDHIPKKPNWCVIPNFVDTDAFSPGDKVTARKAWGLPDDCLIVLSVGMVDKHVKRMDYFIREASMVSASVAEDVHFVIAGSSHPESVEVEELGRELLGEKLTILFNVDRDQMPTLYRAADIFVLCSPREALPVALIEAMSCGLPAVGHTFPVMEWVIGNGGRCVDMKTEGKLRTVLSEYLNGFYSRELASREARRRVLSTFSQENVTQSIMQMYDQVLGSTCPCGC
ncbi:MAG: glycosyltransferase [Candidatus Abyssobacteria bacterium SURF_17]|uniref:Glycosyltransferase n=1 Tax=Candidatus Abyssobacteria bacterium SURF_17 TaxID=2093361 RepID=A0A419F210_9BACT|nr:MAG: glycosyltransferase [Candidatus Abyssubacteria bacterium SURF_17]